MIFEFAVDIHVVICEDDQKCNLLLDKSPRCLRKLITIKETRPATNQRAKNRGVEILRFEDVERLGASKANPEVVSISHVLVPRFKRKFHSETMVW